MKNKQGQEMGTVKKLCHLPIGAFLFLQNTQTKGQPADKPFWNTDVVYRLLSPNEPPKNMPASKKDAGLYGWDGPFYLGDLESGLIINIPHKSTRVFEIGNRRDALEAAADGRDRKQLALKEAEDRQEREKAEAEAKAIAEQRAAATRLQIEMEKGIAGIKRYLDRNPGTTEVMGRNLAAIISTKAPFRDTEVPLIMDILVSAFAEMATRGQGWLSNTTSFASAPYVTEMETALTNDVAGSQVKLFVPYGVGDRDFIFNPRTARLGECLALANGIYGNFRTAAPMPGYEIPADTILPIHAQTEADRIARIYMTGENKYAPPAGFTSFVPPAPTWAKEENTRVIAVGGIHKESLIVYIGSEKFLNHHTLQFVHGIATASDKSMFVQNTERRQLVMATEPEAFNFQNAKYCEVIVQTNCVRSPAQAEIIAKAQARGVYVRYTNF